MSNFPIIRTTPPPLDVNESDEEEEDFRTFNYVSPEDRDIDFVVSDFTTDNDTEGQTSTSDLKDNTNSDGKQDSEDNYNNIESLEEKNIISCDNSFDTKILEKEIQINETNDKLSESTELQNNSHSEANQNNADHNFHHDNTETSPETKDVKEEQEFCDFNGVNIDENNFDFADFTSYESPECNADMKENEECFDENQSISFYKSEISFGDFNNSSDQTVSEAINDSQNIDNNFNNSESDDDFADFASAQPVLNSGFQSVPVSFNSNNISGQNEVDEKDDGFADFTSFQDNGLVDNSVIYSNNTTEQESEKFTELFAQVFPTTEPFDSVENSPNISRDLFNTAEQNSKSLWKQLQDLESAPSLKLKWSTSHSFQLLLTALNIDPRNILKNPSVPMFASGLGYVLEPTKHNFSDDFNDELESENTNGLTTSSIPPVQFDWSSSGLTNPLEVNQKSMVAFDLDFFVTNDDIKNTNKQPGISSFEDELLNGNNHINSESNPQVLDKNKSNLMEQILSSVGNAIPSPQTNCSQVLSAEALQVLDELPNLSFLRAKVLMFPINIKTNP